MFESIAVSVLNSVLGKYIKDLDTSNLRLGILKGRAVLTDLELRADALDGFHLPVEVIHGYVGKISLIIPWTNLYSEPFEVTVHDVYLIARPIRDQKYDPERTKESEITAKRKRLKQIEQRIHPKEEDTVEEKPADEEDGSDSFVDKLAAQIVKNLKISVKNIHFRYEDKITSPTSPFVVGLTLQNLSAETTNELWQEIVVDASAKTVYKIVSLDCLSIYWNTNQKSSDFFGEQHSWKECMSQAVSSKGSTPSDFEFILKPLCAECHVIMDQSSEILLDVPKLLVEVLQQELSLLFSQNQFHNLMDLIESFELMNVNQMYRKYQPTSPVKESPTAWWKYAYTAICEEKIRIWSWARIKEHRTKYKLYKELWKEKLKGFFEDERPSKLSTIQALEDTIDIPSILIARKHAELEVPPSKRFHHPAHEHHSSSWFSWLGFGSESSNSSSHHEGERNNMSGDEDIWSRLSVESLPPEEKDKLYKAIDYNENVRVKYPIEYIKSRITFNLDRCTFVLCDARKGEIAQLDMEGFDACLEHRPAQSAFRFRGKINSFKMLGYSEDEENKLSLVSSKTSATMGIPLVDCTLETKPLHVSADYAVTLKVEPIEATYDSATIDKIVSFFSMPGNSKFKELEMAAANRLQELTKWTRAGLEYAITQHEVTYLDIDVRSPFITIPEYGTLQREGTVLAVDLGHLKVVSSLASRNGSVRELSSDELEEMFYDKFKMTLDDVQVMLFDKGFNWKSTLGTSADSNYHILPSTALTILFQKSITFDNTELPEFKVSSVLPSLHLQLSDAKFQMLMKFLDHLPIGATEPSVLEEKEIDVVSKKWRSSTSTLSLEEADDLQAVVNDAFASRLSRDEDEEEEVWYDAKEYHLEERHNEEQPAASRVAKNVNKIKMTGTFTIRKLLITVDKAIELTPNDAPYLSLEIRDLGADVTVYSWNTQARIKLGFIQLLDNHWKDVDGSNLCVLTSSSGQDWITVNYIKADPTGPEFKTKFGLVEQFMEVRFSSLRMTAKQEAIASFQIFVLSLFQSVGREPDWKAVPQRLLETIPEEDQLEDSSYVSKEGKLQGNSDIVNFKIVSEMEDVTVTLSSMDRYVGKIEVKGLNVSVDIIPSKTTITTRLEDFKISDLTEGTLYPKIVDLTDNTVFDCEVTIFNKSSQGAIADQDPTALDFSVDVKLGKLRFVFLGYFVAHLQNFIQAIVSPETVSYAQDVTQKMVLNQVQYIQKQGAKIGLNISVNAPQILIPCNSKSKEMLVADLGQLRVLNSIISSSQHGLISKMDVKLSSFQVSGSSQVEKHLSPYLIEPVELNVIVKRRLNLEGTDLPLIEIVGNLPLFKVNLGISDFQILMMVINDNLLEGREERRAAPTTSEQPQDEEQKAVTPESLDKTDTGSVSEDPPSVKCTFTVGKVQVNSPKVVNGVMKAYLLLEAKDMSTTVTVETWILSVSAKLGALEIIDYLNTDSDRSPVKLLSSSRDDDVISVCYKSVDPRCPIFESSFGGVEQQISVIFSRLKIDCLQKSLMDLQTHGLALINSVKGTNVAPASEAGQESSLEKKTIAGTVSLKAEAALSELDVLVRVSDKNLAEIKIRGLTAEFQLLDNGLLLKSRQKDLSVVDPDTTSYYPKIISVENENVFDFEFKYFNNTKPSEEAERSPAELTKPDGNLKLNLGRVRVVFLYKFIAKLRQFVEPLTSPQTTQYVQETAQKAVTERIGSIQSQGTRIGLQVTISAPLVIFPRHSRSVDMLLVDLGHLDVQNEFDILPVLQDNGETEAVFDIIELSLQSVQLSRGVMDLSSSSVIKRHLIEPIKLDARVKRPLLPSGHNIPILECSATLDFVKMNLGQQDYHVLTTLFQENLKEADENEQRKPLEGDSMEQEAKHMESSPSESLSTAPNQPEETATTVWDQMVFSFDFVGASLTLYSNEATLDSLNSQSAVFDPATRLCLVEVDKSLLTIVLPSDSSVQIHCLLNGCVVEDVRKGNVSAFPRLIDKKIASHPRDTESSPSQEMCDIVFCRSSSGEMKVDILLQNATIFVNFPFLLPLLEFFAAPPQDSSKIVPRTATASQTNRETALGSVSEIEGPYVPQAGDGVDYAPEFISEVDAATESLSSDMKITVHCVVKEPDIVFLSDASRKDSEALIVQAEVEFDYSMGDGKQMLSAKLTDLQMHASQFPDVTKTTYKVLNPCSMTFKYSTPASNKGGQEIEIDLEAMLFEFSPGLLTTVTNVVKELIGQKEVDEGVQTVGHEVVAAPADLWDTKPASAEYWYKKKATEDSKPKLVKRKETDDMLIVTAKDIQVVLVKEIEGAHVPLLLVQSSMKARANDWSAQLQVETNVAVQISFYNERLAAWEPLLEPIIEGNETTMWEVQLKVFLAEAYVSSFSPQDDSHLCDAPPTDTTDGTVTTPVDEDVTDSGNRTLTQRRSSFRKICQPPSFRRRSGEKSVQPSMDTTSYDEEDLDYDGALALFVKSTQRAFSDSSSDDTGLDVVDAPKDEVDAGTEAGASKSQATYIVIHSHDVLQLTVTPTAVKILSELSQLWTTERRKKRRTVPGPRFMIHNELGIHAAVTVSPKHQISDSSQLTVRRRIVKQPIAGSNNLAGVGMAFTHDSQGSSMQQGFRRISEPLLNRLRDKLQKIRRKRANSAPVSLAAIRERKLSLQVAPTFQVGPQPRLKTKVARERSSLDSGICANKEVVSPSRPALLVEESTDHRTEDGAGVAEVNEEALSARPPSKERGADTQSLGDDRSYSGLTGSRHLGQTVANIGALAGGILAPPQADISKGRQGQRMESGRNDAEDDDNMLSLTVDGFYNVAVISIARAGSYLYKLSPRDAALLEENHKWYLVVQVEIKNGRKTVFIRSPLQIQNHLQVSVDVFVKRKASSEAGGQLAMKLFSVEPGGAQNVPLQTAYNEDIFVKPSDNNYDLPTTPLSWRKLTKEGPSCILACPPVKESTSSDTFYIRVLCQTDTLNKLPSDEDSPHHVIHLYPPLVIQNKLPVDLELSALTQSQDVEIVRPGEKLSVVSLCPGDNCHVNITMKNYKDLDWFGLMIIKKEVDKSLALSMKSKEELPKELLLGVHTLHQSGTREMFIYSPYWLINKTGLHVEYRVSKSKQVYSQSPSEKHPLLFNFNGRTHRKAKLRLSGHQWSSKFSLDAIGDSGKVTCKTNDGKKFEFILQIEISRTRLFKIVTLTPKYVIINNTEISISFIENKCKNALWFVVEPGESKPFWPEDKSGVVVLKPTMSNIVSKPFSFNTSHTTVLRISELQALAVDVHGEVEDSVTTIVVSTYTPGIGTIRIENLCENTALRFHQKDNGQVTVLNSQHMILYTWDDPHGDRKLLWKPYTGRDKPIEVPVDKDDFGETRVELDENSPPVKDDRKQLENRDTTCGLMCGSSAGEVPDGMDHGVWTDDVDGPIQHRVKKTIYWVSVIDGLQRVLIFTDNEEIACLARKCCDFEIVNTELFVSLDGVGLSLVNSKPNEVAYVRLFSSTSVWQLERSRGKWKSLNLELQTWLEDAWRNNDEVFEVEDRKVDFQSMTMTRPHTGAIRRLFEPAVWLNYKSSDHYYSLHCKMYKMQIDNQQIGAIFPVALYPVALPPSVIKKSVFKPFIEMSFIYHQVPKEGLHHIKYAKALVQEMNVKIDKDFVISLVRLFRREQTLLEEESYFAEDMKKVAVPLRETEAVKAALEMQEPLFLEYFHLSPLKINLSFSLVSSLDVEDEDQAFAHDLWDFFFDSIGATLADVNDAELRLAYFQRVGVFITQEKLVSQITRHYTMQAVRQVYVLIFGLDVLGNPYALIHGIGEGVKDFFYEPYQGIIAGPGEFAEGFARGVKSLLGHVIGGTAGAFSRITGSLGQAVATLTFDSNFQMRRRLCMRQHPRGIGQGLIKGGNSLLMGLYFGVSGVVVKPVEGARSDGVEGFFKGIGKGLLGVLTHPAGGIIDMVSFTLDGIRRSAELSGEDIAIRRLPRFTAPNMPLKPFSEHDAEGNAVLKSLNHVDDVYVDHVTFTSEESSFVVLLTDRRIFNLYQSKFWLGWKIRWNCLYEDIAGFPFLTANALVIRQECNKDGGASIALAVSVYEIVSSDTSELESLKSKIENALHHYR
ncbi:intermembrane lipid transfer protein VPS13C-like isoform X1 [Montipora foliosa]|uniref:intermembrane lipid transfer protein VPS13C-like isoform X1 n=1 Tax=Montipora foliosa TaxID=591990 RepID=UPI0035F15B21